MTDVLGRLTSFGAAVVMLTVTGCGPPSAPRAKPAVGMQRPAYLCCTLRFNQSHEASDANYDYRDKIVFPAGTRVHVVRMNDDEAEFVPDGDTTVYTIEFRYGRDAMRPAAYYGRLFLDWDPLSYLDADAGVRDAVRDGRLVVGMTKQEALTARGYPPAHHTPSTDADEWLYYSSYDRCERVRFVDGRIASIEQVEPPG